MLHVCTVIRNVVSIVLLYCITSKLVGLTTEMKTITHVHETIPRTSQKAESKELNEGRDGPNATTKTRGTTGREEGKEVTHSYRRVIIPDHLI